MCICKVYFFTTLDIYKNILKAVMYGYSDQVLNFSIRSYYVFTPLSFITKCFLIFIVDEVKNFATNNNHSSCRSQSHTGIRANELVTNQRFVHQGKEGYYKIKSKWVLEQKFNCRLVFQDRPGQLVRFIILITA